jgi:hypothetical protein
MLQSVEDEVQCAQLEELFAMQRIEATQRILSVTEYHAELLAARAEQLQGDALSREARRGSPSPDRGALLSRSANSRPHSHAASRPASRADSRASWPRSRARSRSPPRVDARASLSSALGGCRPPRRQCGGAAEHTPRSRTPLSADMSYTLSSAGGERRHAAVARALARARGEDTQRLLLFAARAATRGRRGAHAGGYYPSRDLQSPFGRPQPFCEAPNARARAVTARGGGGGGCGARAASPAVWSARMPPLGARRFGGGAVRGGGGGTIGVWCSPASTGAEPDVLTIEEDPREDE